MSEQRLIDANYIVEVAERAYDAWNLAMATQDTNRGINKVLKRQELCKAVKAVAEDAPTVDPETLPVVRELRKELERVKEDRDAAISDLRESLIESYAECMYCKHIGEKGVCFDCTNGINWQWRGIQEVQEDE